MLLEVFMNSSALRQSLSLSLAFLTFYVTAVQWYTQFVSYPISALVGSSESVAYGSRYEYGLIFALYIPYFALIIVNLAMVFVNNVPYSRWRLIAALLLNLSIVVISLGFAVPLHQQVTQLRTNVPDDITARAALEAALLNLNWLRVLAATLASALVLGILGKLQSPSGRDAILEGVR
jgi:hypothetical protein